MNALQWSPFRECNSWWDRREVPRPVWNPKPHQRVHKSLPLDSIPHESSPYTNTLLLGILNPRIARSTRLSKAALPVNPRLPNSVGITDELDIHTLRHKMKTVIHVY
jgi:hypothetical protein